jgi:hypothetical protein
MIVFIEINIFKKNDFINFNSETWFDRASVLKSKKWSLYVNQSSFV